MGYNWGDDEQDNTNARLERQDKSDRVKLDDLLQKVEPLIDQVNALYNQFVTGTERLPPTIKRQMLESMIHALMSLPKPNQTYAFRCSSLNNQFLSFKDRWDRLVKDVESGKIKRIVGPNRDK